MKTANEAITKQQANLHSDLVFFSAFSFDLKKE